MDWTAEAIERLKMLWSEGLSTAEIGRRLNISKNAVVGKAHRLALSARPSPIRRGLDAAPRSRQPPVRRSQGSTLPPLAGAETCPEAQVRGPGDHGSAPHAAEAVHDRMAPDRMPDRIVHEGRREDRAEPERAEGYPAFAGTARAEAGGTAALDSAGRVIAADAGESRKDEDGARRGAEPGMEPVKRQGLEDEVEASSRVLRSLPRPAAPIRAAPRNNACCWPIGEPGMPDFHFCGKTSVAGRPYCEVHVEIAYVRVRDRRDHAA